MGRLIVLSMIVLNFQNAVAQEPPKHRLLPWHLLNTGAVFDRDFAGQKVQLDFQIIEGIEVEESIYFSPFDGWINGVRMYVGCGNLINCHQNKDNFGNVPKLILTGVFSRWGTQDIKLTREPSFGYSFASDHEDSHISNRTNIPIRNGDFMTVCLEVTEKIQDEHKNWHVWVKCTIVNNSWNETYDLGSLRFPGQKIDMTRAPVGAFIEKPGESMERDIATKTTLEAIRKGFPRSRMVIGNWMVDGTYVHPKSYAFNYDERVPQVGKAFLYIGIPDTFESGVSKVFHPRTSIMLSTDKTEWVRGPELKRWTMELGPANKDIAKILLQSEPLTYRMETLTPEPIKP
jgi:hypothetical protein